jgi:hypothetical protein
MLSKLGQEIKALDQAEASAKTAQDLDAGKQSDAAPPPVVIEKTGTTEGTPGFEFSRYTLNSNLQVQFHKINFDADEPEGKGTKTFSVYPARFGTHIPDGELAGILAFLHDPNQNQFQGKGKDDQGMRTVTLAWEQDGLVMSWPYSIAHGDTVDQDAKEYPHQVLIFVVPSAEDQEAMEAQIKQLVPSVDSLNKELITSMLKPEKIEDEALQQQAVKLALQLAKILPALSNSRQ